MTPAARAVAIAIAVAACGGSAQPPGEPDPTEATVAPAPAAPPAPVEFVGVVASRTAKLITADFEGRIDELALRAGQPVKAGDVVARLDASELRARLAQARAQKQAGQAQAARASAVAHNAARRARIEARLSRTGASSPEAVRSAASEASAASADGGVASGQIREAAAQIAELERLIAAADVRAPLDGIVGVVRAKEGEVARKGTPIAQIFDPAAVIVKFAVPRAELARVATGARVELSTALGRVVPATVHRVVDDHDPAIDFVVCEAAIAPDLDPAAIRVGDTGRVRITDKE